MNPVAKQSSNRALPLAGAVSLPSEPNCISLPR